MKTQAVGRMRNTNNATVLTNKNPEQNKIRNHSGNTKDARVQVSGVVKASEKKEQCLYVTPNRKKRSTTKSSLIDDVDSGNHENDITNCVLWEQENAEQPSRKRRRGTDGKLADTSLLSPEKGLLKLRPRKLAPSFQKVELIQSDFQRIVGKRVRVYWPDSRRWFIGSIKSFDSKKKLHKIVYDDGDKEDLDLKRECFELEVMPNEAFNLCSKLGTHNKIANVHSEKHEHDVTNCRLPERGNVEKSPKKRKQGVIGETTEAFSLSREKGLSKLRPRKAVPSFQKVELNDSDFERIVGKRVKVYWPDSRRWFVGCIKSFDNKKKLHTIFYNDGDKEDLDLKREQFELEVMSNEAFNLCSEYGLNLQKKEMRSDGVMGEASNGSLKGDAVAQAKKKARMNKKLITKATKKGKFQRKRGKNAQENTLDMARDIVREVHALNIEDQVTADDVIRVDKPENVKVRNDLGVTESLPEVVSKTNQEFNEVQTTNPKTNGKQRETGRSNEVGSEKDVKDNSVNVGGSDPVKEDAKMKKKVEPKIVKRSSSSRAWKSTKEEKAENQFPSRELDVLPENIEEQAESDDSEMIPVNAVFGNCDEAS